MIGTSPKKSGLYSPSPRVGTKVRFTMQALFSRSASGRFVSLNEYIFEQHLGQGSFAEVMLASRPNGDKFAVKIFKRSFLKQKKNFHRVGRRMTVTTAFDNVDREIAIMKKLIHPNIVRLYEVIDDAAADYLFMVLEYIETGECMTYEPVTRTFASKVTGGPLPEKLASQYMDDIIRGLIFLHANHICHRDLKPENILIGKNGRVKIADFGVSHIFEDEATLSRKSLKSLMKSKSRGQLQRTEGTWFFWAPEMCHPSTESSFSGYAADVWAVGIILWIFLFGRLPYPQADSPTQLFDMIQNFEFTIPESTISPECTNFLFGLLQKNVEERISLRDALNHEWVVKYRDEDDPGVPVLEQVQVSVDEMRQAFTRVENLSRKGALSFFDTQQREFSAPLRVHKENVNEDKDDDEDDEENEGTNLHETKIEKPNQNINTTEDIPNDNKTKNDTTVEINNQVNTTQLQSITIINQSNNEIQQEKNENQKENSIRNIKMELNYEHNIQERPNENNKGIEVQIGEIISDNIDKDVEVQKMEEISNNDSETKMGENYNNNGNQYIDHEAKSKDYISSVRSFEANGFESSKELVPKQPKKKNSIWKLKIRMVSKFKSCSIS